MMISSGVPKPPMSKNDVAIIKIEVFCFIRDEQKFKNIEELIQQLTLDKENIINKNLILAKK